MTILRRLFTYADKIWSLREQFDCCTDSRQRPQFESSRVVRSAYVTVASRVGSLNAFEGCQRGAWLRNWIGGQAPSADTIGRVLDTVELGVLREMLAKVYERLRRNKALRPCLDGMTLLVLDGHEGRHSSRRKWEGCLSSTVETASGPRIDYFPRYVAAQLVGDGWSLLLDIEMQRPNEGELAAAERLFARVANRFPRAFDIVLGDALYASGPFWRLVRDAGKHVLTVLKQEARDLLKDARALLALLPEPTPQPFRRGTAQYWDVSDLQSWPQAGGSLRVVRSLETRTIHRQLDDLDHTETTEWVWVTSLPKGQVEAAAVARLGHERWRIENNAFNELVNGWGADHLFRCAAHAIEAFLLLMCLALNVFQSFWRLNLKPAVRARQTASAIAGIIRGELLACAPAADTS